MLDVTTQQSAGLLEDENKHLDNKDPTPSESSCDQDMTAKETSETNNDGNSMIGKATDGQYARPGQISKMEIIQEIAMPASLDKKTS